MSSWVRACLLGAAVVLGGDRPVSGGSYADVEFSVRQYPPGDPNQVQPYAIVHPIGYDGSGGGLAVNVCVAPEDASLLPAVQVAVDTWTSLTPAYGNCFDCHDIEEAASFSLAHRRALDVILHELGHCAMGLGHPNMREVGIEDPFAIPTSWRTGVCDLDSDTVIGEFTSFTSSVNATEIGSSVGTPRGDSEDQHLNQCPSIPAAWPGAPRSLRAEEGVQCCPTCPGPNCPVVPMQVLSVAWFRKADNDPVTIDSGVVDSATFSRSTTNLPAGHHYAANANLAESASLGHPGTQAIMYSQLRRGSIRSMLTADDVNMVRMGESGADRLAGTGDDYLLVVNLVPDCADADVEVEFEALGAGELADCENTVLDLSFVQPGAKLHYTLARDEPGTRLLVKLNSTEDWDLGIPILIAGFEPGDTSEWSLTSP